MLASSDLKSDPPPGSQYIQRVHRLHSRWGDSQRSQNTPKRACRETNQSMVRIANKVPVAKKIFFFFFCFARIQLQLLENDYRPSAAP